jgi:hydroxypyruvate reductase
MTALPGRAEALLAQMFWAAVERASPRKCLVPFLPERPVGRTVVVGAGKAAAAMARVVEDTWSGPLSGLVITRYGHAVQCGRIEVVEASHPMPDDAGARATGRLLSAIHGLSSDDLVLCLLSGGGSALMPGPVDAISLADERILTATLLRSGAPIADINCVRKHISSVKGGRLAQAAAPARIVTLVISDVPGDDPSIIASGPTVADPTTRFDAMAVLDRYAPDAPAAVREWLLDPASETPKPGELERAECTVIATPALALEAAALRAAALGYAPLILGSAIEGEAREVAAAHAEIVRGIRDCGEPLAAPCVVLSGGETTVTVKGGGRGGRNTEFLLALAVALDGAEGVSALAADTDGIDGTERNAGAVIGPATLEKAAARAKSAPVSLADNDGYGFFEAVDGLFITGPTLTNVNDFRAILIDPI